MSDHVLTPPIEAKSPKPLRRLLTYLWSEDESLTGKWFEPWEEVAEPRIQSVVSDTIINVQTGTGNRIEFWDAAGKPIGNKARIRRYIDVGRLTRGR